MCYCSTEHNVFLAKIQEKREEMFSYGKRYGLGAIETITCSRELDQLLNEYYRLYQSQSAAESASHPRKHSFVLFAKPLPPRKIQTS